MDNCRMNYTASRSCRVQPRNMQSRRPRTNQTASRSCNCSDRIEDTGIYKHADQLPLAMAYVPCQQFSNTFNLSKALQVGTIFPELCKPFCGRRCVCR